MNIMEAQHLLGCLEESEVEEVRVVIQLSNHVKIGDFIPAVKAKGYAAMVQTSALANVEILVTNANTRSPRN